MVYYKYEFNFQRKITKECICLLLKKFFDTNCVDQRKFKIFVKEHSLILLTNESITPLDSYDLVKGSLCVFSSKESLTTPPLTKGDTFQFIGVISRNPTKDLPQFGKKDEGLRFDQKSTRKRLRKMLNAKMGIEIPSLCEHDILPVSIESAHGIENAAKLEFYAEVVSPELFQETFFNSYLSQRFFGLGWFLAFPH